MKRISLKKKQRQQQETTRCKHHQPCNISAREGKFMNTNLENTVINLINICNNKNNNNKKRYATTQFNNWEFDVCISCEKQIVLFCFFGPEYRKSKITIFHDCDLEFSTIFIIPFFRKIFNNFSPPKQLICLRG